MRQRYLLIGILLSTLLVVACAPEYDDDLDIDGTEVELDVVSWDEVAEYDSEDSCWVGYKDYVYDMTDYLSSHPGGEEAVADNCGTVEEFTDDFIERHGDRDELSAAPVVGELDEPFFGSDEALDEEQDEEDSEEAYDEEADEEESEDAEEHEDAEDETRVIEVEGYGRTFEPDTIDVEVGETVEFVFTNTGGTHDFVIPELDVGTEVIGEGETDSFTYTFDEEGNFEFICSVGNHAEEGMVGEILVE